MSISATITLAIRGYRCSTVTQSIVVIWQVVYNQMDSWRILSSNRMVLYQGWIRLNEQQLISFQTLIILHRRIFQQDTIHSQQNKYFYPHVFALFTSHFINYFLLIFVGIWHGSHKRVNTIQNLASQEIFQSIFSNSWRLQTPWLFRVR